MSWEIDFEVALRVLRRRWWDEVEDLVAESQGETLAWDELDLDSDLSELEKAASARKLERLAQRLLALDGAPEPDDDPALKALEAPASSGRAFLRLMGANLAFALRTDELVAALGRSVVSGARPRLSPASLGRVLSRARSARRAREVIASLELDPKARDEALATVKPSSREGDFAVLHARSSAEQLGAALARALSKKDLVPVEWGVRRSKSEDSAAERYLATRPRRGWTTLIARGGVSLELAVAISGAAPSLGRIAWISQGKGSFSLAFVESGKVVLSEATLRDQLGSLEPDDVSGALRALGISAHDPEAPGGDLALAFEAYVPEGRSSSPARLRRQGATGFAFSPSKKKSKKS